ncbi:hypothetical protein GCM10027035_23950 [Emticicia sediminis]
MKTREDFIRDTTQLQLERVSRYVSNIQIYSSQLHALSDFLLGKSDSFSSSEENNHLDYDYLHTILCNNHKFWTKDDKVIKTLIKPISDDSNRLFWVINSFVYNKLISYQGISQADFETYLDFFKQQGFSDENICDIIISNNSWAIFYEHINQEKKLSPSGKYLLNLLESEEGIFNVFKTNKIANRLNEKALAPNESSFKSLNFQFLLDYYPKALEGLYERYMCIMPDNYNPQLDFYVILYALDKDAVRFERDVLNAVRNYTSESYQKLSIYFKLDKALPNKYEDDIDALINEYYTKTCKAENHSYFYGYISENYINTGQHGEPASVAIAKYLLEKDKVKAIPRIEAYISYADFYNPAFPKFLSEYFGQDSLPYLVEAIHKNSKYVENHFHAQVFGIIQQFDFSSIADKLFDYAINHSTKATRELATETLAKLGKQVFSKAKELLSAKNADNRIVGALVLSKLNNEEANEALKNVIDTEKNDDTRDIIIEALNEELYGKQLSLSQIKDLIIKAEKRGKLSKLSEKWIDERDLPAIYWIDDSKLNEIEVRFLFYRMARGKGLNSDTEIRQTMNVIDKTRSGAFAKKLIQAFADSGSNTKFKHYLTTGGQLGGDEVLPTLKSIFTYNMGEKRYKMAEYAVEALGMIGTNKALRNVEVISRKFASKRPSVSERAIQVLSAAATELNISTDELADRIIPDFEFEGLFKTFDVDGEEYRAFISSDFTLCFFDEDNKLRKSVPKNTNSELKKEFKEIEKEVRDIVKSQSGRLEKYLIEERQWTSEQWQAFFLQNPIMFVYSMKLLWAVFDENHQLKNVFYCHEDTSLYNYADEEIELEETDKISILHPIYLTPEQINLWKAKIYELDKAPLFPQLDRTVFRVPSEEQEKNYTRIFANQDIPKGADFVASTIEKYGWIKSTGDGGHLELVKKYPKTEIRAYASIEGVYAWYQGGNTKATVHEISFIGKNWQEKVLLNDISPVFFSEVIYDIQRLIDAK